ncbi:hypothetical protein OPV22_020256 [Ensete ventricosum]|uniref:Uncharacterized protein n=1 Tax=Ensete ventricosum TaxID=4639 RepID=A0AAV8QPD8_ENSVE|nr:hypothetical protein OPV22_020256 [Ensete ventricosum]
MRLQVGSSASLTFVEGRRSCSRRGRRPFSSGDTGGGAQAVSSEEEREHLSLAGKTEHSSPLPWLSCGRLLSSHSLLLMISSILDHIAL